MNLQIENLKIKIDVAAESLLNQAQTLKRCTDNLIRKIENGNLQNINSLGEIQGVGGQVDVKCMELKTLLYILEDLEKENES